MTIRHYLDYNATCPVRPEVIEVVTASLCQVGNSSSIHEAGRAARKTVEDAREKLRQLINAPVNGIVFTGGGTEAIHYGINGSIKPNGIKQIFVSSIEHAAVSACAKATGIPVEAMPVTADGVIDLEAVSARLSGPQAPDGPFLFCLMMANNETGVIQPVEAVAELVHKAGGLLLVDAAQAVGKIPVNFVMSGADMMVVTAHKFGGPVGAGALVSGPNLALDPVMRGGGHESNRRAGTHNVAALAGLGIACDLARDAIADPERLQGMRSIIEAALEASGARIWGKGQARLPGTVCYSAPGFSSETQIMSMDLAGIAISSGSACSSGKTAHSHVLTAMGVSPEEASSAARLSIGWASTDDDVAAFCEEWPKAFSRIKERVA